jgi:hypothetical protein
MSMWDLRVCWKMWCCVVWMARPAVSQDCSTFPFKVQLDPKNESTTIHWKATTTSPAKCSHLYLPWFIGTLTIKLRQHWHQQNLPHLVQNILLSYNFICHFVWMWESVSSFKHCTKTEGLWEWGAEWRGSDRRMENTAWWGASWFVPLTRYY